MTLGSHQKTVGASQSWITPQWLIHALGTFDLDPCAANPRPWDCALMNFDESVGGLTQVWPQNWRVYLNPPFDRYEVGKWIKKLAEHNYGTALLHVRTEAAWFEPVWQRASAILFLADRLYFHYPDGRRAEANSGAPACLCAFGLFDAQKLKNSGIHGYLVEHWNKQR